MDTEAMLHYCSVKTSIDVICYIQAVDPCYYSGQKYGI